MSKPTYQTTSGERLTRSQIETRITKAKAEKLESQREEHDYNFCEDCKRSTGTYLDCSHNESVRVSLAEGRAELTWDHKKGMKVRCRPCHLKHDNLL